MYLDSPKIVIRTPNWLGDLMMSTAFINSVLAKYPDSTVDLIVKKGFEKIPLPQRGQIIPFDKKSISAYQFGRRLRKDNYKIFFVLPPSTSSALMAFASKAELRIGYKGNLRGVFLNQGKQYLFPHRSQHLVSEYFQLLDSNDNEIKAAPGLSIDDQWISEQIKTLVQLPKEFISIAPGAMYGPAKQWPLNHYQKLASIISKNGLPVVVIGTKDDQALGNQIAAKCDKSISICGDTNLNQMIAVLALSKALVSNDSGTMHVMAALQKPQVAIFGSTSTTWTGPVNTEAKIAKLDFSCSPCFKRICPLEHTNCLNEITPEMVWEKLESII